MAKNKQPKLTRVLSTPLTDDEADSLTEVEKDWLRSWNRHDEIPGDDPEDDAEDGEDEDSESTDYTSLSNDELRAELASRGLPTGGNKDALVERLEEDDDSE